MARDIEIIRERIQLEFPDVEIAQLKVSHPGIDDDGLWFVRIKGKQGEVQLESSEHQFPFLVESTFSDERREVVNVDEALGALRRFLPHS
ncbi:MAG: hypothetical protein V4710_18485 [Verrucomicrobiota bacterium]